MMESTREQAPRPKLKGPDQEGAWNFRIMQERVHDLEERLTVFAARIVVYVDRMPNSLAGRYDAGQLLRSGGSPAMHYGEAQGQDRTGTSSTSAVSRSRLKGSSVNLRIQMLSGLMPKSDADLVWLTEECGELVEMIGKNVSNKKRKGDGYGSAS